MKARRILGRFAGDQRGNIAMVFGMAMVPMLISAGAALDFMRQSGAETKLQAAVDTAALARGSSRAETETLAIELVKTYLRSNGIDDSDIVLKSVEVKDIAADRYQVNAKAEIQSSTLRLVGFEALEINASSEVERGYGDLELALVLDNTASMNMAGKMDALKDAATELVNTVFDSSASGHAKISVVPFSNYVNIGEHHRGAPWLSITGERTESYDNCSYPDATRSNCRNVTTTCYNDGAPYSCTYEECDWVYGAAVCTPATATYRWFGCVGSPANPDDTQDSTATMFPAIIGTWRNCPNPLLELSSVRSTILDAIDDMAASGETYIPAGLSWGWKTISPQTPLTGAITYDVMRESSATKAIVLMTDGINSLYPTYPDHVGIDPYDAAVRAARTTQSNDLVKANCDAIAAEGIRIYTIAFDVPDDGVTKPMLEYCARNGGLYFDASDRAELMTAFQRIGRSLAMLRIAK